MNINGKRHTLSEQKDKSITIEQKPTYKSIKEYLSLFSNLELLEILEDALPKNSFLYLTSQLKKEELRGRSKLDLPNIAALHIKEKLILQPKMRDHLIDKLPLSAAHSMAETIATSLGEHYSRIKETPHFTPYTLIKNFCKSQSVDSEALLDLFNITPKERPLDVTSFEVLPLKRLEPKYPLREYQIRCCEEMWTLKERGETRALLHLPTGAGKTRTAINFVAEYLREKPEKMVLWLANTVELCDQATLEFETAWQILGNRNIPRYAYYGASTPSLSGLKSGFLVAGLQKIYSTLKQEGTQIYSHLQALMPHIGLIVFDEAHMAIAPSYQKIVEVLSDSSKESTQQTADPTFILGLSATPGRKVNHTEQEVDPENWALSEFFHHNKINMHIPGFSSPIDYLQQEGYLAHTLFETLEYEPSSSREDLLHQLAFSPEKKSYSQQDLSKLYRELAGDDNRNQKIIKTILQELKEAKARGEYLQIILFACTVEHARELEIMLAALGVSCRAIDSTTESQQRSRIIEDYRRQRLQILINYSVLTAGFDAPNTRIAMITRPTSSLVQYIQMAGRAMRGPKSGGNAICKIYTVNDELPEFQNMFKAFNYWDNNWKAST